MRQAQSPWTGHFAVTTRKGIKQSSVAVTAIAHAFTKSRYSGFAKVSVCSASFLQLVRSQTAPFVLTEESRAIQMRVSIYVRVSTDDKGQDPINQLSQLRDFAAKQGWKLDREYIDRTSAKNGERAEFKRMWKDAELHRFDCLLFWSLARLTRESVLPTLQYLRSLGGNGIKFKGFTEQYVDSVGVFGPAIIGILAADAQQERIRLSERTKADMARVRATGKHLGQVKVCIALVKERSARQP
jgi:DNA invertase Pin-like site-specific DNA recombinase